MAFLVLRRLSRANLRTSLAPSQQATISIGEVVGVVPPIVTNENPKVDCVNLLALNEVRAKCSFWLFDNDDSCRRRTSYAFSTERLRLGGNTVDFNPARHRRTPFNKGEGMAILNSFDQQGNHVDSYTYVEVMQKVCKTKDLAVAKKVHDHISRSRVEPSIYIMNNLLKLYINCGSLVCAQQVYDKIVKKDLFTYNIMIGGYAQNDYCKEAFQVFQQMQQEGVVPNSVTYMSILNACTNSTALQWGKEVHTHAINATLASDVRVGTALIKMYANCGSIEDARQVFDKIVKRDIIAWTRMIGAYAASGHGDKAYSLFLQMQQEGPEPDAITYLSILNPCASAGALNWVGEVHSQAIKARVESDVRVGNAFINMYAKSGNIKLARTYFDKMATRDVISWTVMIGGFAQHGRGEEALQLFEQMKTEGYRPDDVTFMGVLSACSHSGLVDEGRRYFLSMSQDYGIRPTIEHYGCMVDVFCRAGHLDEAFTVIMNMSVEADAAIWMSLLCACRTHVNVDLAEHAAEKYLKLNPENASVYVLLSGIYAAAGMWDKVSLVRNMMKKIGVRKEPGRSWIEVDNVVHSFVAEDRSHPRSEEIYVELKRLTKEIKVAGYVPNTRFVMHDMEEQWKEEALCFHSEKLAIAYGLISTTPKAPVRIFKNLRVCSDCHTATKFISMVVGREIVARDTNRFHHFKDGVCSCGDYW